MIRRFRNWLLRWLHSRCQHDGHVAADIHEGDNTPLELQWCTDCGAIRVARDGDPVGSWRLAKDPWTGYKRDLRAYRRAATGSTTTDGSNCPIEGVD